MDTTDHGYGTEYYHGEQRSGLRAVRASCCTSAERDPRSFVRQPSSFPILVERWKRRWGKVSSTRYAPPPLDCDISSRGL